MAPKNLPQPISVSPSKLKPHLRNPREHPQTQIDEIAASIAEHGWYKNVVCAKDWTILAGHGSVLAATQLELDEITAVQLSITKNSPQALKILAGDNHLAELSFDNEQILADLLREVGDTGDLLGTGWSEDTLAELLARRDAADDGPGGDADDVPEVPVDPVTKRGDVWLLGPHRVMCGDCRDADDVAKLLDGASVNLAFTSPPYADRRDYDESSGFKPIKPDEYVEWFEPVAANVAEHLADDGSWFVNIKAGSATAERNETYVLDLVLAHVRMWGWNWATEFCWERIGVPGLPERRFKNQFEPVFQFSCGRWKFRPDAVRHQSDSVPVAGGQGVGNTSTSDAQGLGTAYFGKARAAGRPASEDVRVPGLAYPGNRLPPFTGSHEALGHGAAFPVGMPDFFVRAYTDEGDTVYDPFMGSGSTLLAAHQNKRIGYGMELSPKYVDVICARFQRHTGIDPILEATGEPHDWQLDLA